jgi:transmembrane sensor
MDVTPPGRKYFELAEKWLNGTITPEEEMDFDLWYNSFQDAPVNIPVNFAVS